MKATLHFEHDESKDLQDALDGWKWKHSVWDLDNEMRSVIKHGYWHNREATDVEMEVTEYWRAKLRELVNENNLNLNI